jgi:hypothetical protein
VLNILKEFPFKEFIAKGEDTVNKKRTKKVLVTLDINTFRKLLDLSKYYGIAPEKMARILLKQQLVIVGEQNAQDDQKAA